MLGGAWIADRAVIPAIKASSNGRLVSVASRNAERARELVSRHSFARVAGSYEAVLEDRDVDAVYIPLVNSLHREWTVRALSAGKHVLCEKPLAMNAVEAKEMAEAAQRARLRLMEAFMYRFNPRTRAFVESVRDPLYVQAAFGFTLKDRSNYRAQPALGGGAILDVGCYAVSGTRWILGEPDEVFATMRRDAVDMTVTAMLHFPSGATASVWVSFEGPEEQRLVVVERDRTQVLDQPFTWRNHDDPYQLMVESFAGSVIENRPVAIPPGESVANMTTLDRIREVAEAGILKP